MAATSSSFFAPPPAALLRHGASPRPTAAASPSSSCRCHGRLQRPSVRLPRRRPAAARPVRFCVNGVYGWPAVPRGWTKRGPTKGLCAAGAHDDAVNQVGEDVDDDGNGVRVSNEALRATIRKSREVLAMHRDLLDQISEKKKLISVIEASAIHNGQEPFSGSPFSSSDAVSEGKEIGYDLQMYLDRRSQKSEIRSTHGESISGQHEYYGSLEGKLSNTDVNGRIMKRDTQLLRK
ncbi:unnamed protein product [Triticum turgidum subsp. durum]|uniref:Uncharacterized protein n=1 Tax=Triticum turgidum subsp. durum TaxID=4567 RepID=A0A9R0QTP8_TRITD|nr:unnamed protein product [Triticum turgidum subsp. durum]